MPSYKTSAIVLKKTKLKEKDLILTLLSDQGEQIRAVAKGAQKPGSTFAARLEVFSIVDLMLYKGKSLDTITDVRIAETNKACRDSIARLSYGAVMAELIEKTALEGQEMPVMFALSKTAFSSLGAVYEEVLPFVAAAFLIKLLAYLGYKPSFDECIYCGKRRCFRTDEVQDGAVFGADSERGSADDRGTDRRDTRETADALNEGCFSISSGGWVCGECAYEQSIAEDALILSNTVFWIRALMSMRFVEIEALFAGSRKSVESNSNLNQDIIFGSENCDAHVISELGESLLYFCERWINTHLGIKMKSMRFLSRIDI